MSTQAVYEKRGTPLVFCDTGGDKLLATNALAAATWGGTVPTSGYGTVHHLTHPEVWRARNVRPFACNVVERVVEEGN